MKRRALERHLRQHGAEVIAGIELLRETVVDRRRWAPLLDGVSHQAQVAAGHVPALRGSRVEVRWCA